MNDEDHDPAHGDAIGGGDAPRVRLEPVDARRGGPGVPGGPHAPFALPGTERAQGYISA